ncbi:MAG: ABC transporter permease [Victivallaceae bacterium]|nr:ABC transporter permease [Victivallaceae bacterium]
MTKSVKPNPIVDMMDKIGGAAATFGNDVCFFICFLGELAKASLVLIRHPGRFRGRDMLYYMDLCGSQALPIVICICYLMGVILGFQFALQAQKVGAEIYVADGVGFSILKELGPLMVAVISTGRAGSAFAAEIGTMKVNEEISALETMGFSPVGFLVVPKLLAMLFTMPLLIVFGDFAGLTGGFTVAVTMMKLTPVSYIDRTLEVLLPSTLTMGVLKGLVFAAVIALVGCMRGFQAKSDAQGVGRATTSSVVSSIFMIVVADAVLTRLYTLWGY